MRLPNSGAAFRATTRLRLCLLLLVLPACTNTPLRMGRGLALSAQKTRPHRFVQIHNRPGRAVVPGGAAVTDFDEMKRLFRGFVEWQGNQDSDH